MVAAGVLLVGAALAAWQLTRPAPAPEPVANRAFPGTPAGADGRAVVWAVGDGATGSGPAKALAAHIAADHGDRVLYLGDVYESGTPTEFREHFASVYGPVLDTMLPTPGNHEWGNHLEGYDAFWRRTTSAPTPPWYALRVGGWQVLSLNSEAPHGEGDEQLRWLQQQLARPATCRLAFWHRPRFSAGRHGDQDDVAPLWDAVVGRATLILNGHDHDVQRLKPVQGTVEIVDGAGGADLYSVDDGDQRLAFADDQSFAAARLSLGATDARVQVVTATGRVLDRTRVPCVSPKAGR
jgi:hypothetical protein